MPGADGVDGQDGIPGVPGPVGAQGATGPAGPQGSPGPQGADGNDGVDGNPGIQGPTGPAGATGNDGTSIVGPPGVPGADGADGSDGIPGAIGPTGATGPTGASGNNGNDGPPGTDGIDGQDGIPGAAGATGSTGATGATGNDGAQGPIGFPGSDGADGNDGIPGATGAIGPTGPTGATGASGTNGNDGPPGSDGIDGNDGIPGPQGAIGPTGATGPTGVTGANGNDGAQGPIGVPGNDGNDGSDGIPGLAGAAGPIGPTGPTGASGNDGAQGPAGVPGQDGADGQDGIPGPAGAQGATGNTGPAGAPSTALLLTASVNFGSTAQSSGTFDITGLSGLVVNTPILVEPSININDPTESEQSCVITGYAVSSSVIRCYWNAIDVMQGTRNVQYAVPSGTVIGLTGPQGPPGQDGLDGYDGIPGGVGPAGPAGPTGPTGNDGQIGPPGFPGADGQDGNDGIPGAVGTPGTPGSAGPTGATGLQGFPIPGDNGSDGYDGIPGPAGINGTNGTNGSNGATGSTGPAGVTPPAPGIVLSATNQSLQIITATGADIDIEASFTDLLATVATPGSQASNVVSATTTTLVSAPAASTQRTIVEVTISNTDTTLSQIVTVQKLVAAATFNLLTNIPLGVGERIEFTADGGWRTFDAAGRERIPTASSLTPTLFSPGTQLGLPIDAGGSAPGVVLPGAQQGENVRWDTGIVDSTSSGAILSYDIPEPTTEIKFVPPALLTIRSIGQSSNIAVTGRPILLTVARTASFGVVLNHFDAGEASTAKKLICPGDVNLYLGPGEACWVMRTSTAGAVLVMTTAKASVLWTGGIPAFAATQTNVTNITLNDGINTAIAGGPSPPNGGTLRWDFRKNFKQSVTWDDFEEGAVFTAGAFVETGVSNGGFLWTGQGVWNVASSIVNSTLSITGSSGVGDFGVVVLSTGNTTNNFSWLRKSLTCTQDQMLAMELGFSTSNLINTKARFGLTDTLAGGIPANGVWIEYDVSSGAMVGKKSKASAVTTTTGTLYFPTAGRFMKLRMEQNVLGTWEFFAADYGSNFTSLGTITGTMPTVGLQPWIQGSSNLTSATTSNYSIDYYMHESQTLGR